MFFERLQLLCSADTVKDISGLLKTLGLSTSKGTAWKSGSIPKGDILLKIASYFHVSTDYLLGNTDDPSPMGQKETPPKNQEAVDPATKELYAIIDRLSRAKLDLLLEKARELEKF